LNGNYIEVDGGQHADSEADRKRSQWLEHQGFRVLRFWNNEVLKATGEVLDLIISAARQSSQNPSPGAHR
jgi:very-short-patch-repair endonuclease